MAHSDCGWTCGCAGKTVKSPESTYVPYLSASAVVIHYEEALYQVYAPLPLYITAANRVLVRMIDCGQIEANVRWYWLIESKVLLGDWKHAAGNVVDRHTYVHVYRTRTDATATAAAASAAYSAVSISRRVDPQTLQRVPSRRRQTISSESLQSTWFDNFDRHASLHITVCWLCVTEVAATVDGRLLSKVLTAVQIPLSIECTLDLPPTSFPLATVFYESITESVAGSEAQNHDD